MFLTYKAKKAHPGTNLFKLAGALRVTDARRLNDDETPVRIHGNAWYTTHDPA